MKPQPGTMSPAPVADPQGLRILWINCRLLHPLNGGDRIRTYNMLKQLKRKHRVTYVCFRTAEDSEEAVERASEFCHELITVLYRPVSRGSLKFYAGVLFNSLRGDIPFMVGKYRSAEMTRRVRELAASDNADLIVADYLASVVHLPDGAGRLKTPVLVFQHNVESQIWKRHAETEANLVRRAVFRKQWRMTCNWERASAARVDGQVAVSEDDCRFFREQLGMKNVLGSVPTGVDVHYFAPSPAPKKPRSLIFLGAMDWLPNIDAVCYFTKEVFPLVRRQFPEATVTIVGRNPAARVQALAQQCAGVRVTGTVTDVRPFLAQAEAMIVPLRIGGGTRIKICEAMATGIPVVSTRVGAEGLPVTHGRDILLADSPQDFAKCVGDLFSNTELRSRIGDGGLALVRARCGWEHVTNVFEGFCRAVCANRKQAF